MRFVNSWATPDKQVLVLLSDAVIATFLAHRQDRHQPEAGGILLGRRRGRHFEVVHATEPAANDRRTRVSFIRESYGHQEQAVELWERSLGEIGYVGEWHTHPEATPCPSLVDIDQWSQLPTRNAGNTPMLGIIVGTRQLCVALLLPNISHTILQPEHI
ncbi:Mov34/MPN/PAD-1 family protein [Burkholderia aenigmatica]|uniref:Mov34/MPN/PAD-1 family protein n=1 Tax=Burkholderia TaxID=32008 RepID=UPI001582E000|nr:MULTISPECIES: Mov34/MPN/PAD-1 family protein [Burkholderia cepacia complex]